MKKFPRPIAFLFILVFLVFSIKTVSAAQECPVSLQVTYPGGERGCLTDLPLSKKTSKNWGKQIQAVAKFAQSYMVVSSERCEKTEIFTSSAISIHSAYTQIMKDSANGFVAACSSECNCAVVINNGAVLLNKTLAMAIGASDFSVADSSLKMDANQQSSIKENLKITQTSGASVQQAVVPSNSAQLSSESVKGKEAELLAQISAELSRLRAETDAIKEERKALAQTIAIPMAQKPFSQLANRKALVIGNDNYKFVSPLSNAREDAKTIALELGNVGYNVTLKLDVTEKELKSILRTFKNQIEAGDEVAFFYAGHGVQLDNSNFLLPVDVAGDGEDQVRDEAIALQRILEDIASKKAKFTLAMIDACRDNPFKGVGRSIGGGTRGLAPTTAATGQMVIFSAGSGQQALDKLSPSDKSKNGLFTRVFAKEIKTPGVSVDRLVRNVRNEVVNLAKTVGHEQVPAIYDQVVGEFYFRK